MTADAGRTHIAGMSLKTLRNRYHKDLFDLYLPFMDRYGIDHELGGFICALDHDGTRANTDKYMWYQGRGLWVYSYLYNHFGGDYYLEIARKTRDFIVRYGQDDQGGWYTSLDRDGRPNSHIDKRGYAGLFVAEGLQAFAAASGDQESLDLSIRILWDMLAALDDPQFYVDEGYVPVSYPGMRTLGSHMVLILILTQILTQRVDPALDQLAGRVRDGIMNRFWNPEYRLLNEVLTTDYRRPDDGNEDFVYLGHAIETMWMMMHEAIRLNDRELLGVVAERFHRHVEVAWDDVYGGVFRGMNVHGSYLFDKVLWAQEEVLIGTMILMEHTDLEWPAYWFDKMYRHIQETFSLQPRGLPHYQESGDRKMTFKPHVSRKENYHHPRHLMLNLLSLERMMKQ